VFLVLSASLAAEEQPPLRWGGDAEGGAPYVEADPSDPQKVAGFDVEIRAGVHTGEVELRGGDVGGIGVHIGARIAALAGPGEILVSRTVRDLVRGSGITLQDRGTHRLKGVPDAWQVYAVGS